MTGNGAMPDLDFLKRHLQSAVDNAQVSQTERFVLAFGRLFSGIERPRGLHLGYPKCCFENAAEAVCNGAKGRSHDYCYVEGYAAFQGQPPFHHAWIALDHQAIELTLKGDPSKIAFFGVAFSRFEVIKLLAETEYYGFLSHPIAPAVHDLFRRRGFGFPLSKRPRPGWGQRAN